MKGARRAFFFLTLTATSALGQTMPTGTLTGTVTDGKVPLPGVTVTVTSPNLQGARIATSTVNGDYILDLLPPGLYTVRFELERFQAVVISVKVSAAQLSRVDPAMPLARVAERVTVTGTLETISTTAPGAVTHESDVIQSLPVNRDISTYLTLTPATLRVGPPGFYQIAGAPASENLYLINGVAAGDNVNGGFLDLYIEDAIQEATTTLSSVSAEYGRFSGGVVDALTKSGGNQFHGSLRTNLTNPKWTAPTPLPAERTDQTDRAWEGTLGGYVLRDTLWFFLAGRAAPRTFSQQTYPPVSLPVQTSVDETRYEGKLTLSLNANHRLIASYMHRERVGDNINNAGLPVYDLASFTSLAIPEDLIALNYAGVLSNTLFAEGQYSARHLTFGNSGSQYTDVERGTPVYDETSGAFYNSAVFCSVCPASEEGRNSRDLFAKAALFLPTGRAGSHDLRIGVDVFDDMLRVNNWQSGSGYFLDAASVNIVGTGASAKYFPVILPDSSIIEYYPIFQLTRGNHFRTDSAFANDVWRLDNRFTFNIGLRFDKNDGTDASGTKVVKDSKWSPRLSATWNPKGDGDTQVVLGYGQYVAAIANGVADSQAGGGEPAEYWLVYEGPAINATGNEVETHDALRQVFAWLESIGGALANPQLWIHAYVPGYQVVIGNDLRSPSTTEWTVGVSKRLGTHGLVRVDYIDRTWTDLYSQRVDTTTGKVMDPQRNVYDRIITENDPRIQRRYRGVLLQVEYRFGQHLRVGGNYTWSRLFGNDLGYADRAYTRLDYYPEYRDLAWYAPNGYLQGDHRHELSAYASWEALDTRGISLNVGLLQGYASGAPYGATSTQVAVAPYVTNPGYATPPLNAGRYSFTRPDAYRTDAVSSTDLAVTMTFKVGNGIEIYVNPQIRNAFNNQAVVNPNTTVYVNGDQPNFLAPFDPFTETPKECPQGTTCSPAEGYNWQKGPQFGRAVLPTDYQTPRTFLLNVGVRF